MEEHCTTMEEHCSNHKGTLLKTWRRTALTMEEYCSNHKGALLAGLLSCLPYQLSTTCPGSALLTVGDALLHHQLAVKNAPHRHADRPIWWQALNGGSLFCDHPGLCHIDIKLASTMNNISIPPSLSHRVSYKIIINLHYTTLYSLMGILQPFT